jgi:hypothetical protein
LLLDRQPTLQLPLSWWEKLVDPESLSASVPEMN